MGYWEIVKERVLPVVYFDQRLGAAFYVVNLTSITSCLKGFRFDFEILHQKTGVCGSGGGVFSDKTALLCHASKKLLTFKKWWKKVLLKSQIFLKSHKVNLCLVKILFSNICFCKSLRVFYYAKQSLQQSFTYWYPSIQPPPPKMFIPLQGKQVGR